MRAVFWIFRGCDNVGDDKPSTGRTLYRRTVVKQLREPTTGKKHRKVTVLDSKDWIEVPDGTPTVVDTETFVTTQRFLDDPERSRRGMRKREYGLSRRLKCLRCGRVMVGQTLQGRYKYYKCRRSTRLWTDKEGNPVLFYGQNAGT